MRCNRPLELVVRQIPRSRRWQARGALGKFDAEQLGGLDVDDERELSGPPHRQIGGLFGLEDIPDGNALCDIEAEGFQPSITHGIATMGPTSKRASANHSAPK